MYTCFQSIMLLLVFEKISWGLGKSLTIVAMLLLAIVSCSGHHSQLNAQQHHRRPLIVDDIRYPDFNVHAGKLLDGHKLGRLQHQHRHNHGALIGHIARVESAFTKYAKGGYLYDKPKNKVHSAANVALKSAAFVIGAGVALKKCQYYNFKHKKLCLFKESSTTTSTTSTTPATTATPSTTTPSTATSTTASTTTPSTTISTTASTTTPSTTTTPATPTTTTKPVPCTQTTVVNAMSVGAMGNFSTPEKVTGNEKFCQSVTSPPGTKISVVCTVIDFSGASKTFKIYDGSGPSGAVLAQPFPIVGQTYTSSSNAIYFEVFLAASDKYSCKWTVV